MRRIGDTRQPCDSPSNDQYTAGTLMDILWSVIEDELAIGAGKEVVNAWGFV